MSRLLAAVHDLGSIRVIHGLIFLGANGEAPLSSRSGGKPGKELSPVVGSGPPGTSAHILYLMQLPN
jgi:hypothetical protein